MASRDSYGTRDDRDFIEKDDFWRFVKGFEANGLGLVDAANFVLRLKLVCRAFQNEVAESMRLRRHSVVERVEYSYMESNEGSPLVQHWCTYTTTNHTEGVPLVSCHRMLEPGSSCHFFSSIFLFGQSDFQVSKTTFDSREILLFWSSCYFFGAPATFWSSCWVLAYGGGSSVRRPLTTVLSLLLKSGSITHR